MAAMNNNPLKGQAAFALLVGFLVTLAVAAGLGHRLGAPEESTLLSLGLYLFGGVVLWSRLPLHSPHERFGLGNLTTLLRGCMIVALAGLVLAPETIMAKPWLPLVLAAAALALDGFDGRLARRQDLTSAFGAWFDQELDGLFVLVLAALTWRSGQTGPWILAVGLFRYLFLLAGLAFPRLAKPLPASQRRRFICVYGIGALIVCLIPQPHQLLTDVVAASALCCISLSFALDVGWLMARKN